MQTKGNRISFKGQNIYVGIDSHLKSWKVTIMTEELLHKTFSQDPRPEILYNYLENNFPGGNYYSAYEASFCGFWLHRQLTSLGIKNIVVNPADIPTTDKERKYKEDKRDSRKIAKSLRAGELTGIYIPTVKAEEMRSMVRYRSTLIKDIIRCKNRIKMRLYFHGIEIPPEYLKRSNYWSNRFTDWIKALKLSTHQGTIVLQELLDTVLILRKKLLMINKEIRLLAKSKDYKKQFDLLTGIPGIGTITAMTLLTELEDINRFKSIDNLCSYVGLVPTTNSSGESEKVGGVTPRSKKGLRKTIIESAWIAARRDPALSLSFNILSKRMEHNKAIIRIAKKLLNRVRYVLINEKEYVFSVVS